MPRPDVEFNIRFDTAADNTEPTIQKGVKSIILLTLWRMWKTRNDAIFKNINPSWQDLVQSILKEARLWMIASAKALCQLPLHARPPDAGSLGLAG